MLPQAACGRSICMVIVIVRHFVRPGMVEAAQLRVDANGDRMAAMPGFLFRHAMMSCDDPCKLVTTTAWESAAHYESWCEQQRTAPAGSRATAVQETPYVNVETELLTVVRSHESAR